MRRPSGPSLFGLGTIVVAAVAAAAILWNTRWSAPLALTEPEALFAAGPFKAGDAFEQTFDARAAFLSNARIAVKADAPAGEKAGLALAFRLLEDERIVREGRLNADVDGGVITPVTWEFEPVRESAGKRYLLRVVVEAGDERSVFALTTLRDFWPGSLVTNGIPTGDHIDLALVPGRSIARSDVLRAVVAASPGGPVALLAGLMAVGAGMGAGLVALLRGTPRGRLGALPWLAFGFAVAGLSMAGVLRAWAGAPAPERTEAFWLSMLGIGLALILAPWIALGAGKGLRLLNVEAILGHADRGVRPERWALIGPILFARVVLPLARFAFWRRLALAASAGLTAAGLMGLVATRPEARLYAVQVLEGGSTIHGRFALLRTETVSQVILLALVAWTAYGVLIAGEKVRARLSSRKS